MRSMTDDGLPPCFRQLTDTLGGDLILIWDDNGRQGLFSNPGDMELNVQGAMITLALKQIAGEFISAGKGKRFAGFIRKMADDIEKECAPDG